MEKQTKDLILKRVGLIILLLSFIFTLGILGKYIEIRLELEQLEKQKKIINLKNIELLKIKQIKQKEIEKQKFLDKINSLDLIADNSITKFVNNKVHYNDLSYIPKNLVSISGKYIIDGKGGYIKVRKILKENLEKLSLAFNKATGNNIIVVSGYRSYIYQKGIKDRGCPDNLCAKAGYSEHQSGLAIDIYSASTKENWANNNNLRKYYFWFKKNAWKYGFTNTYQKGLKIDGYEVEPWHWRYVGKDLAKYLLDNNLTFAEFYNKKLKKLKIDK